MTSKSLQQFPWRLFWVLYGAGILSALAIIPIAVELFGSTISSQSQSPPLPFPIIIVIGVVQNLILLAAMIFVGLKLGSKLGLGAPILDSLVAGKGLGPNWRGSVRVGLMSGVAVGIVLFALVWLLVPLIPKLPFVAAAKIQIWKRVLACFYGGIFEELFTRLCLLTLFAWIASKVWRDSATGLTARAFWIANILVAILFGLGHLPSASLIMQITPLVVGAALLLNGIAAVVFGVLYRKLGLESAMIAHFTADFVLYVVGASFL